MNELLRDFLCDTGEAFEQLDELLTRFARDPADQRILASLLRHLHTIKGSAGFLDLPRLEALAKAGETLLAGLTSGPHILPEKVACVLTVFAQLRHLVAYLDAFGIEAPGDDQPLVRQIEAAGAPAPDTAPVPPRVQTMPLAGTLARAGVPPERRIYTQRVLTSTLDEILGIAAELVIVRNQLAQALSDEPNSAAFEQMQNLSRAAASLRSAALKARMHPFGHAADPLSRLVQELARTLGKPAQLLVSGSALLLDSPLFELIRKALAELVRNALRHGIESPGERHAAGKSETALLHLAARSEAGQLVVEVRDDGRGFGPHALRGTSAENRDASIGNAGVPKNAVADGGSEPPWSLQDGPDLRALLPGIGLAVLRADVEALGGTLTFVSAPGQGAIVTLRLPEALSVTQALLLAVGTEIYAIPMHAVAQIIDLSLDSSATLQCVNGLAFLHMSGDVLPLADLATLLDVPTPHEARPTGQTVVVMRHGAIVFGITVSAIASVQEIVARPLPGLLGAPALFSGAALLSDGRPALILGPGGIASALGVQDSREFPVAGPPGPAAHPAVPSVLVFRDQAGVLAAVPLSAVMRVEPLNPGDMLALVPENVAVRLEGAFVPVITREGAAPAIRTDFAKDLLMLIVGTRRPAFALVAAAVLGAFDLSQPPGAGGAEPGVSGVFQLGGESVRLVDLGFLLKRAALGRLDLEDSGANCRRALLIDADAITRDMLSLVLAAAGCQVIAADSMAGASGALAAQEACDVMIIDLALAVEDEVGWTDLRLSCGAAGKDALGLCAFASRAELELARRLRIPQLVGKFDRMALVAAVRERLSRRSCRAQAA